MGMVNMSWNWWALALSAAVVLAYELRVLLIGRREPQRVARDAHARLRADWVRELAERPGFEIVAVQTLRNSLMSATITASTAALCLMGAVSLTGGGLAAGLATLEARDLTPPHVLELLLILALFSSFVCASLSMRYYNHVGFAMSMPAGSAPRAQATALAVNYIERAGYLHGWSLRCFLTVAPLVAGIVNPLVMPLASAGLIWVLWQFDRPGAPS
jgi:hypothetical protein